MSDKKKSKIKQNFIQRKSFNTMDAKCGLCKEKITVSDKYKPCESCKKKFHLRVRCLDIRRDELRNMNSSAAWNCKDCRSNDSENLSVESVFSSEDDESDGPTEVSSNFTKLIKKIDNLLKHQKSTEKALHALVIENKKLNDQLQTTVGTVKKLDTQVSQMRLEINALKQKSLDNDIMLTGVPFTNNENLCDTLLKIGEIMQIPIQPKHILAAYRLKPNEKKISTAKDGNKDRILPVVVKFSKISIKHKIMAAKKELGPVFTYQILEKIGNVDVSSINNAKVKNSKINITDLLTPYNRALLYNVQNFANDNGYEFVWFKSNSVWLRKNANDNVHRFGSFEDLDSFKFKIKK